MKDHKLPYFSVNERLINAFIHSSIHSFVHSFNHSFNHSLIIQSLIQSFIHSFLPLALTFQSLVDLVGVLQSDLGKLHVALGLSLELVQPRQQVVQLVLPFVPLLQQLAAGLDRILQVGQDGLVGSH